MLNTQQMYLNGMQLMHVDGMGGIPQRASWDGEGDWAQSGVNMKIDEERERVLDALAGERRQRRAAVLAADARRRLGQQHPAEEVAACEPQAP
eukprot:2325404-Alexandrium_andersonii.AAC.1